MMKIELSDLIANSYTAFIRRCIEYWIASRPDIEKEMVLEIILEQLDGKVIRAKYGEKSKRAYIWRVATRRCIDHTRYLKSGTYSSFSPIDDPYLRKRKKETRIRLEEERGEPRERLKPRLMRLCEKVQTYGISGLKHQELFEAYAFGLTRREVAEKFQLTEQQVKGRIEYTRKKIMREIKRYQAREELKNLRWRKKI